MWSSLYQSHENMYSDKISNASPPKKCMSLNRIFYSILMMMMRWIEALIKKRRSWKFWYSWKLWCCMTSCMLTHTHIGTHKNIFMRWNGILDLCLNRVTPYPTYLMEIFLLYPNQSSHFDLNLCKTHGTKPSLFEYSTRRRTRRVGGKAKITRDFKRALAVK